MEQLSNKNYFKILIWNKIKLFELYYYNMNLIKNPFFE